MAKGMPDPPFPGPNLAPLSPATLPPPAFGYRVIAGSIWISTLILDWYKYHANAIIGAFHQLPLLARRGTKRVYFTDRESIQGLSEPGQFAQRLSLSASDHALCQSWGILVIGFLIPDTAKVSIPRQNEELHQD